MNNHQSNRAGPWVPFVDSYDNHVVRLNLSTGQPVVDVWSRDSVSQPGLTVWFESGLRCRTPHHTREEALAGADKRLLEAGWEIESKPS